jgi:hypothetical protein
MTPTRLAVAGRDAAIRHACAALAYGRHDAAALALGGFIISTTEHDCATAFEAFDQAIASARASGKRYAPELLALGIRTRSPSMIGSL